MSDDDELEKLRAQLRQARQRAETRHLSALRYFAANLIGCIEHVATSNAWSGSNITDIVQLADVLRAELERGPGG